MCTLMCTESFEYCEEQRLMECFKQCEVALRQSNRLNRIPKHLLILAHPLALNFKFIFVQNCSSSGLQIQLKLISGILVAKH